MPSRRGSEDREAGRGRPGRPPASERDSRLAGRREALLEAAESAVRDLGEDVTMTQMAARAGVTKPVLYRYFGDRARLYEALAARYANGLLAELRGVLGSGPAGRPALEMGIDTYLAYIEANAELYRFLARRLPASDPEGQRLVVGFLNRVANDVTEVLRESLEAAGIDARGVEVLGYGVTGAVQLGGEAWLERGGSMSRSEAVAYLSDLVWHGLVGAASHRLRARDRAS